MDFYALKTGCCVGPLESPHLNREVVKRYAKETEDFNPIHLDRSAAEKAGFVREVVQGMLVMGLAQSMLVSMIHQPTFVDDYQISFRSPVYVEEKVVWNYRVTEGAGRNDTASLEIEGTNQEGDDVIRGRITLRVCT